MTSNRRQVAVQVFADIKMDPAKELRYLSVVPKWEDVCSSEPFVLPNVLDQRYSNAKVYLDIQFRQLREDFFSPLRRSILQLNHHQHVECVKGVRIYMNVKMRASGNGFVIQFPELEDVNWEESNQLACGSLLILSVDDFNSGLFFIVTDSNPESLSKGILRARCVNDKVPKSYTKKTCTMIESVASLDDYCHVAQELQRLPLSEFPLRDYILGITNKSLKPEYLARNRKPIYDHITFDEELDQSQSTALFHALTNQVALIQGPPATGKTFIGLKIIEILLQNSRLWRRNNCPILILSDSIGELNQLLNKMNFTDKIALIEGQFKQSLSLKEKRTNRRLRNVHSQRADVVAMTTAEAVRNKPLIEELQSRIVMEAAAILESHIVASLTSSCQHLIMIGDQKQPKTQKSLFKRLINLGVEPSVLNVQHRMRPELSHLIVPFIYSNVHDAECVKHYPPIKGMEHNIFFKMHEHQGQMEVDDQLNCYEMAVGLAGYLSLQGYKSSQIIILTTCADVHCKTPQVQVTSVEDYKEESDIVILCLVRRGENFQEMENSLCVALSKARQGFYLFGDVNFLNKKSNFWKQARRELRGNKQLGSTLSLKCNKHSNVIKVQKKEDFPADGGCGTVCHSLMPCGHICEKLCHLSDSDHLKGNCVKRCLRQCPEGHVCKKMCCEPCGPCGALIKKEFPCGHASFVECHRRATASCEEPCRRRCPMGHSCPSSCSRPCITCPVEVLKELPCGHSKWMKCSANPSNEICMEHRWGTYQPDWSYRDIHRYRDASNADCALM